MSNRTRPSLWRPSRRDVFLLGVGGLVAAVPFARRRPLHLVRRNVPVMGTFAEFAVADADPARAHAAIDAAMTALRNVDAAMSRFNPESEVGRMNRLAAAGPVAVSEATHAVLEESLRWAESTSGEFDPCLGAPTVLWDVTHRTAPPPDAAFARYASRRLYRKLDVGRHAGVPVVRFDDPDVQVDLGGIAKGYGVDRAVDALRAHGVAHALVGAGGDVYALGRSPAGEPWQIGVQSPDDARALAGVIALEDAAVATSGDYQQFFEHGSRRYHHLLDPGSGAPRLCAQRSVSIVAGTCASADAGATAAFGMSPARAAVVLERHGARVAHSV